MNMQPFLRGTLGIKFVQRQAKNSDSLSVTRFFFHLPTKNRTCFAKFSLGKKSNVGHGLLWMVARDAARLPTRKGICAYATTQIPFSQFVFYGIISLLPYRSG